MPVYYSTPVYYYDTSVAPPASLLQPELVIPTSLCQRPAVRIVCCRLGCARFLTVSGDLLFVTGDRARVLRRHSYLRPAVILVTRVHSEDESPNGWWPEVMCSVGLFTPGVCVTHKH